MSRYYKSDKLNNVLYDIRGPVLTAAEALEHDGYRVLKLNIGNPAPFGFDAPEELIRDVKRNLMKAQGYCESKGIYSARKAVMQDCQQKQFPALDVDDIYLGNGVSELIVTALQGLLNNGDEVLIPAPDYPLWTAACSLASGHPVHYRCDESAGWSPDLDDIRSKITPRTRAITVINPNNPTGAVYPKETLEAIVKLAEEHGLIVFADEIYDKILYDETQHTSLASICGEDVLCVSFNGLSKSYRAAGFRSGWMIITGPRHEARSYIEALNVLSSMRLCANVPAMHAVQAALGGYQSINDLVLPGGRLKEQRDLAYERVTAIDGISCVKPEGALYLFPKIDTKKYGIVNDEQMVLDLLMQEKILLVHGTAFNWPDPDHFRIVTLPHTEDLTVAFDKMDRFFSSYRQS